jgi:branched-chain amino acid transport system ATP-binding protein
MATVLQLEAVSKAFGRVVVADAVTIDVTAGETIGIVGPNGAGKTSLLDLISGNLTPDAGRIRLDGRDVTNDPTNLRARLGVGRTYQVPRPFGGMTVFENALLGACYAGRHRASALDPDTMAVAALDRTGLLDRANRLAGSLPLLDRKRLELARALATEPRLLLLDEIAGGLTEHEVVELVATIRRLRSEGVTIVWIEHVVPALMAVVDRLVALSRGRILMVGAPAAVMADPAVQAEYLGAEVVA